MKVLQSPSARSVYRVAFGSGGRHLVTAGSGGIDIWDLPKEGHTHLPSLNRTTTISACEGDPLGRWFYLLDSSGLGCRTIPFSAQDQKGTPCPRRHYNVRSLAVAADGTRLILSGATGKLRQLECWATADQPFTAVWAFRNGQRVEPLAAPPDEYHAWYYSVVALSPDGRLIAAVENRTNGQDPVVALHDGGSGEFLRDVGSACYATNYRLTFTPDGKTLIGYDEKAATLWDTATASQVGQLTHGRAKLHGLAIHPSGQFLITTGADQTARTWDLASLRQTQALKWTVGKLSSVALSPDGTLAAAGGEKGQVVLWDIA